MFTWDKTSTTSGLHLLQDIMQAIIGYDDDDMYKVALYRNTYETVGYFMTVYVKRTESNEIGDLLHGLAVRKVVFRSKGCAEELAYLNDSFICKLHL